VTHDYRIVKWPLAFYGWLYGHLLPHHHDMRPHLQYTLQALAQELGRPAAADTSRGDPQPAPRRPTREATMPDEPATATRTMGIVHGALRRDLARIRMTLTAAPYPQGRQRTAIAALAVWMMDFLHHHHGGEDVGLWPAVRAKNAAAAQVLDQ